MSLQEYREMAYVISKDTSKMKQLSYLPKEIVLPKTNEKVILDSYKDTDYEALYKIFEEVVDEGQTYPQDEINKEQFQQYYLSHHVFVMRDSHNEKLMGAFYVKPNFPGRSSHICNAGFLVDSQHRKKGIGEVLFKNYLPIARDLGYEASFFNLVYASNQGSLKLCRKLGFKEIGIVPKAGKLKGLGYVDAYQFYYDLTNLAQETSLEN
ncbi:L-azetidine-2-carboxylic acid acetyltransferase, partial [Stegodyphus mimosarum]